MPKRRSELTDDEKQYLELQDNDTVTVCKACLTAACLLWESMCDEALSDRQCGSVEIAVSNALKLDREHPEFWIKLREAEGCVIDGGEG